MRPDVQYHTSFLAQFMQSPTIAAYEAALGVLAYLVKTKSLGVTYGGAITVPDLEYNIDSTMIDADQFVSNHGLIAISDASWGVPRPYAGHVVMFANGPISWLSRRLKIVCDSSCEAETASLSLACKNMSYVRRILADMGVKLSGPVPVVIDNSGTFGDVRRTAPSQRTKHFDRWVQYARGEALALRISVHLVSTKTMLADVFTKALVKNVFVPLRDALLG